MQPLDPPRTIWVRILTNFWCYIRDYFLRPFVHLIFPSFWVEPTDQIGVRIRPTSEIPGPNIWLPLLGDALNFNKIGGPPRLLDYISSLHEKYGPIVKTKLGPQKFLFVNHPIFYKEITRAEPKCPTSFNLPVGDVFYEKHKINRGLFFQDGEKWHHSRALLTQLILKETGRYMETLFDSVDGVLTKVVENWKSKSMENADGLIRNVEQDCYEFFLSSILIMTFGKHYEMFLSQAGSSVATLANAAIQLNDATFDLNAYPIQIATILKLKAWKKYQEYTLQNLNTGRKCADIALEAMGTGGSLEEFGLLYRLKNVCNASDEEIRIHCTDLTLDISDPFSLTSLWTLYALGRNADVQENILKEIERVCGAGAVVRYKDLEKLPYLNATCKEVLRMYPTAPLVIRKNDGDVVIGGFKVTSDYSVILSTFYSHKNPLYFYNPEKFWPERWMWGERDDETRERKRSDDAYYPFGIGKRACAGKLLVQNLMRLYVAKIVQNFVVESDEVGAKMKIMLYPDGDMNIKLKPR